MPDQDPSVAPVASLVRGAVDPSRLGEVRAAYEAAIAEGLPPPILATYLMVDAGGDVIIATFWRDRAALQAVATSGEEPLARRLIREGGGTPLAEFFTILAGATRRGAGA